MSEREGHAGGASAPPASRDDVFQTLELDESVMRETFRILRTCGAGRRECQVLWTAPWRAPRRITRVIHPRHAAHRGGFRLDDAWLTAFWGQLADRGDGIRVQVHTHPGEAFHSATDDAWPIVHTTGFLSLVIPDFARAEPSLNGAYLCGIDDAGRWCELDAARWMRIITETNR